MGKAAPPSPPLPSWDPVETLPHCACCQRSPGLYTAARHHVAPAAAPTGHDEGLPGPARSPGTVSPARDAFEERRSLLPWR